MNEDLQTSSLDKTVENPDFDRVLVLINLVYKALPHFSLNDLSTATLILLHFFHGYSKSSHNLCGIDDRHISSI